ncbi:uncharacterized protein LOC116593182 isoform X2 [Mustela erminea]|uniref:uncharacterized protein LOC116593182 isoform X2 n=1 Tax=Mustela erminea TaxID=36723 RepID=UPI001386ED2B|nr:uncharacterized protein LOC116593182 isoform X2 [Mustela erminea]
MSHGHSIKPSVSSLPTKLDTFREINSYLERMKSAQQRKAEPGDRELMTRLELDPAPSKARTPVDFQDICQCLETFWFSQLGDATGVEKVGTREAANLLTMCRSVSTTQNCLQMSVVLRLRNCTQNNKNSLRMFLMSHVDISFPSSEKFENRRQYIILASPEHKNKFMEMTQLILDI